MTSVNILLDKARELCGAPSDAAFAERIGVTRQLVSQWRKGATPIPDDRIAQLARLCKDDAGKWLVSIRAEQSHGEAAKAWATLARRIGAAAAVGVAALLSLHTPTAAATSRLNACTSYVLREVRRFAAALIALVVGSRRGRATTALLA